MSESKYRLTRRQVREIDRRAIEDYHVPGIVLMENAAYGIAIAAIGHGLGRGGKYVVVCGGGNNGGDGLAVARHLHNAAADVQILLTIDPARYSGDALVNWRIVQAMRMRVAQFDGAALGAPGESIVIDAIFGTGLSAPPRDPFPRIARAINASGNPVLAVDLPSGLDCDTGEPLGDECVRATWTATLVEHKAGFANPRSHEYTGEVSVWDIGCPREIKYEVLRDLPA